MLLIFGLGPIGASIGAHLAEAGRDVGGVEFSPERARAWADETGGEAWTDAAEVDWARVDTVLVAVRTADQTDSVLQTVREHAADRPLTVYIVTTLAPADARRLLAGAPAGWRMFEAPVSGGPTGARDGSMTIFLAGPERTADDASLLEVMSGHVFAFDAYGHPALVKLVNNTLGTYNLVAVARFLGIAEAHGVDPNGMLEVLSVSTGHSWMSDHFEDVQQDLLIKDVHLFGGVIGDLPTLHVDDATEAEILAMRAALAARREK